MVLAETNFSLWIDGSIVAVYLLAVMWAGIFVRKYVSRVEDFLMAGREMNLYLGIASLAATEFGIITCMYTAQAGYLRGFSGAIPGLCQATAMFLVGVTGFCVKPLRDSGATTLPELFEKRFGRFVRWLSGVVIVMGGLLNMGVFLKIGGDFLCIVCGFDISNLVLIMTVLLLLVMVYTILGGMLSVLVTDFLQFIVMSAGLLAVTIMILYQIGWEKIVATVEERHGAGGFNPLAHADLGWSFVIAQILVGVAVVITWQTTIARLMAAKDSATGQKIFTQTSFFFVCRWAIPGLWGIAALAMIGWNPVSQLSEKERGSLSAEVKEKISTSNLGKPFSNFSEAEKKEFKELNSKISVKLEDTAIRAMPTFLRDFVPIGLMGLLIAAMLAADMSTDSSYMLSWGSVIYNDILAPFRKTSWSHGKAIMLNRFIVALIGIYLLVFGLFYQLEGDVWSFMILTGSIYLASMSVLLIACCYWPPANDWGALGAIVLGAVVPITHLIIEKMNDAPEFFQKISADQASIATYAAAAAGMIVGSLLKRVILPQR